MAFKVKQQKVADSLKVCGVAEAAAMILAVLLFGVAAFVFDLSTHPHPLGGRGSYVYHPTPAPHKFSPMGRLNQSLMEMGCTE